MALPFTMALKRNKVVVSAANSNLQTKSGAILRMKNIYGKNTGCATCGGAK